MKKIQDQISDALYERLSSPFFHSFVIAWIYFNRNLFIFLFHNSNDTYAEKVSTVDDLLNFWDGIVWPLLTTFWAVPLYVGASWLIHNVWEWFIVQKQNTRTRIRKIKLFNEEDANILREMNVNLRQNITKLQNAHENEITRLERENDARVKTFKEEISKLNNKIHSQKEQFENSSKKNFDNEYSREKVKEELAKLKPELRIENIAFRVSETSELFDYLDNEEISMILSDLMLIYNENSHAVKSKNMDMLEKFKLVSYDDGNIGYYISDKGEEFKKLALSKGF